MKEPKFFIKIQKTYQEGDNWFVQGVASGTLEDRDEERMSRGVLEKFAKAMPLPLTDNHPANGDVLAELGEVVDAKVLDDDTNSLFVKAKLDMDHPAVPYMVKQMQKGKKFAFSIEGLKPVTQMVWSDNLKKMITEYIDVMPKAISITTEPSYSPSFMEVVSKSSKFNNLSKNTDMEDKEVKTETEEVKVEEVKTETPEVKVEATEEVKPAETVVEETPVTPVETPKVEEVETKEEVKTETPTETPDVVVDKPAEATVETPVEPVEKSKKAKVTSVKKQLDPEEVSEAVQEAVEELQEEEADDEEDQREYEILMGLCMKVDQLTAIIEKMVQTDESVHSMIDETQKSFKSTEAVLKSLHTDIEVMKDLPLQKKSRVVSKSYDNRVEEEAKPKTMQEIVSNFI